MRELEMVEMIGSISRKFMRHFKHSISSEGLSTTDGMALWHVKRLGSCKASDLAEHLGLSPSTMTGVLDRLESRGWILRQADPEDRRAVTITGTQELTDFVRSAKRAVLKDLEHAFRDLPQERIDRLCEDLSLVLEALEAEERKS